MVDVITRLYAELAQSKNAQARIVFLSFLVNTMSELANV